MDMGLMASGWSVSQFCESWEPARRVLQHRHPDIPLAGDVREFYPAHRAELLAAGFPCVDLSHAGKQAGIFGESSGLVSEVFRITSIMRPEWVVLENVPNLLRLGRGAGIKLIIDELEALGYSWAYRVVDSRSFGVAQRRNRVIIVASERPGAAAEALLGKDTNRGGSLTELDAAEASGFYWTEGRRGVGLVRGAVPTLKGGSTLGLPSAPAIWRPHAPIGSKLVLPTIEDAEELQGLPRGWTEPADLDGLPSSRWKLVGNAVTVGVGKWVGNRLTQVGLGEGEYILGDGTPRDHRRPWPDAAFGGPGHPARSIAASRWPTTTPARPLHEVLASSVLRPLSHRATKGFLSRIEESGITLDQSFLFDLEEHLSATRTSLGSPTQASWASSDGSRRRMQKVRQQGTTPETRLRRALTDRGLRYRLQLRPEPDLRWRSDIVFPGPKVIVDVRGCFWHACPLHSTKPKENAERWREKLEGNRIRDLRMEAELTSRGWLVITVWEHEDASLAADRIRLEVDNRRASGPLGLTSKKAAKVG